MLDRIQELVSGYEKQLFAWVTGMLAWITLDNLSKTVLIGYTGALLFSLIRDKWWRERKKKDCSSSSTSERP